MSSSPDIRDFVIQIAEVAPEPHVIYTAHVTRSPRGNSKPEQLKDPFNGKTFEVVQLTLENAVLQGTGYRGRLESREEKILQQFGTAMFDVLFRENLGIRQLHEACLRDIDEGLYRGLRIKLEFAADQLSALPWEFMFDSIPERGGYLCLYPRSQVLRHLGDLKLEAPVPGRKIKMLAMIANPAGYGLPLNVALEREVLDTLSGDDVVGSRFHLRWVQGDRWQNLLDMINKDRWDIFHFVGHGGFDADKGKESGFVIMGDDEGAATPIPAQQLAQVLTLCPTLKLAVLNCCKSARGNSFASPGAALSRARIPAVVAMQYPIWNLTAVEFTRVFYGALLDGVTLEHALTTGRIGMKKSSNVEWGIPVLYSRFRDESFRFWASEPDEPDASTKDLSTPVLDTYSPATPVSRTNDSVSEEAARKKARRARVREMFRTTDSTGTV